MLNWPWCVWVVLLMSLCLCSLPSALSLPVKMSKPSKVNQALAGNASVLLSL